MGEGSGPNRPAALTERDNGGAVVGATDWTMEATEAGGRVVPGGIRGALDGLDKAAACCPLSLSSTLGTQVFVESGFDAIVVWVTFVDAVALSIGCNCPFENIFLAAGNGSPWGVLFGSEFSCTVGEEGVFLGGLLDNCDDIVVFSLDDPVLTWSLLLGFLCSKTTSSCFLTALSSGHFVVSCKDVTAPSDS